MWNIEAFLIDPAPDPFEIHKVVAKRTLASHSKRDVLEFTSDVDGYLVYDELHLKDDASERKSLERYIDNLLALWRQHKGEEFHELWFPKLEHRVRGRLCLEDIRARNGKIVDKINDAKYALSTTARDLKYVYGAHTVFVFVDYSPDLNMYYSMRAKSPDCEYLLGALCLVRIKGRWMGR